MNVDIEKETDTKRIPDEKSEVSRLCCENSKTKEKINLQPQFSGRYGLMKTKEWLTIKENFQHFKTV